MPQLLCMYIYRITCPELFKEQCPVRDGDYRRKTSGLHYADVFVAELGNKEADMEEEKIMLL